MEYRLLQSALGETRSEPRRDAIRKQSGEETNQKNLPLHQKGAVSDHF